MKIYASVITGLVKPLNQPISSDKNPGKALQYAYETDQTDRMQIRSLLMNRTMQHRDSLRLLQVLDLHRLGQVSKPMDKFHAAFIIHHGTNSAHYALAYKLAHEASQEPNLKDVYLVQWLPKASYDRWMVSLGQAQKYGTQGKFSISVE